MINLSVVKLYYWKKMFKAHKFLRAGQLLVSTPRKAGLMVALNNRALTISI